jgi:hypothetical protein
MEIPETGESSIKGQIFGRLSIKLAADEPPHVFHEESDRTKCKISLSCSFFSSTFRIYLSWH